MKKLVVALFTILSLFTIVLVANASPVYLYEVTSSSGWVDVEQVGDVSDSNLCWAASASDILAYTGWIGTPNLGTADQILNNYKNNWTNGAGNASPGIYWWFTGTNLNQGNPDTSIAHVTTTIGFYSQDLFTLNITNQNTGTEFIETQLYNDVTNNGGKNGISLVLGKYFHGQWMGNHVVTLWGIDTETDQIFITNSNDYLTGLQTLTYDSTGHLFSDQLPGAYATLLNVTMLDFWQEGIDPPPTSSPVPIPGAVWLFGSGLIGLVRIRRKFKKQITQLSA